MKTAAAAGAVALLLVPVLLLVALGSALTGSGSGPPSAAALGDVPADKLALYQQAALVCPGLDWTVLAAVGKIETDHGRSRLPGVTSGQNHAGAGGPMQFLQATFDAVVARHPPPPGGQQPPSRYDPHDAVFTAAHYLCDSGAGRGDLRGAIFAYNHSQTYVDNVLAQAARYASAPPTTGACQVVGPALPRAATALAFACAQLGQPYVWGGDGAELTELADGRTTSVGGFDCSGLTKAAYAAAGIDLPRKAQWQFDAGPQVPGGAPILPGDLVFFGAGPTAVTHVGIAISGSEMINAPHAGAVVRIERIWRSNLVGVTRPTAGTWQ